MFDTKLCFFREISDVAFPLTASELRFVVEKKLRSLGQDAQYEWGEMQGSGKIIGAFRRRKSLCPFFLTQGSVLADASACILDTCCRCRYRGKANGARGVALATIVSDPTLCSWCVQTELSHIRVV